MDAHSVRYGEIIHDGSGQLDGAQDSPRCSSVVKSHIY